MSDTPKKRGAPPGNTNALKHGYYSPRFRPSSSAGVSNANLSDLPAQIDLLRAYIRQVKDLSAQMDEIHDELGLLRVLSLAMSSLNHLLRVQQRLSGTAQEKAMLRNVLSQALDDLYAQRSAAAAEGASSPPDPAPEAGS